MNSLALVTLLITICQDTFHDRTSPPTVDVGCVEAIALKNPQSPMDVAKDFRLVKSCSTKASKEYGRDSYMYEKCLRGEK